MYYICYLNAFAPCCKNKLNWLCCVNKMTLILIHLNVIHSLRKLIQMFHGRHSLSAACEKYILLDQRIKKCKLKASQIHFNSALTMTDWCCCSHGACLQNGLLLFTNATSAPSRQSSHVYVKLQHYIHRKDGRILNGSFTKFGYWIVALSSKYCVHYKYRYSHDSLL